MDHDDITRLVEAEGYKTRGEIMAQFKGESSEVVDTNLQFLVSRNKLRRVKVARQGKSEDLYYIPG